MDLLICDICKELFAGKRGLGVHRRLSHGIAGTAQFDRIPKGRTRLCRYCKRPFEIKARGQGKGGNNRQYCCYEHSRLANRERVREWHKENRRHDNELKRKRFLDDPSKYKDVARKRKLRILEIVGKSCAVCGISDPLFLQVHYKPGVNGYGWRHSRHPKFIEDHKGDFITLCANHHQELTITGAIRGFTTI